MADSFSSSFSSESQFGGHGSTSTSLKPVVRLVDVKKTYVMGHKSGFFGGKSEPSVIVHALRGVTVTFYEGEFIAIMGSSGSGKSTMLNLLGCLDRPTDGQYYLGDQDIARLNDNDLSEIRSRKIGFIFQSYNLVQQYTVVENIQIPLTYQGSGEITAEQQRRTMELAELVGLADRLDHKPMQLSGGQQQRVAIARSLVNDPYIVLADEATGNLDSKTAEEIMNMLTRLNDNGTTIVMVTHEEDIAMYSRRIIRMKDGMIIDDQPSPRMKKAAGLAG